MWLAAHLFFAMLGTTSARDRVGSAGTTHLPLAVFATAYFFLNTGLVAGAVTIGRETSFYQVWREHFSSAVADALRRHIDRGPAPLVDGTGSQT